MSVYQEIPLNKLVPSPENVRRTGLGVGIDELAASIAAHGLLQNLPVKPVLDEAGADTGKFAVVAGGRRYAALKLLAKQKRIAKTAPVGCNVLDAADAVEISLAENVTQLPMHPADQYEAFEKLHREQGMTTEDIAARFGLSVVAVRQRMKLGAVSPTLMQIYRDGGMNLEQLMVFTVTDDHPRQERVWSDLSRNKSREAIRRALTEDQVSAADRRAICVGAGAYQAAGGVIVRDLFDDEHAGFFADAALLDRLVREKLEGAANEVAAEGWKWTEVTAEFNYSLASGMRRVYAEPVPLSEGEQSRLAALEPSTRRYPFSMMASQQRPRSKQNSIGSTARSRRSAATSTTRRTSRARARSSRSVMTVRSASNAASSVARTSRRLRSMLVPRVPSRHRESLGAATIPKAVRSFPRLRTSRTV